MPPDFARQTVDASCCRKICAASADRCTRYPRIFDEVWDGCYPTASILSRFGPCGLFLVPEVKILPKSSPISGGRGGRRKFDTGPSRNPAKHVPGRVPELEKNVGSGISRLEGSTLNETSLIKFYIKKKCKKKFGSLLTALVMWKKKPNTCIEMNLIVASCIS